MTILPSGSSGERSVKMNPRGLNAGAMDTRPVEEVFSDALDSCEDNPFGFFYGLRNVFILNTVFWLGIGCILYAIFW
jgi:hypothetical protein